MKCECGRKKQLQAFIYIDANRISYPLVLCPECVKDMEDRTNLTRQGNIFKVKE